MKHTEVNDIDPTRYRGQISLCEIDLDGQRRLARAKVLMVGAGGLGSPVGLYLAGAGVGTIGIADPDTVSLSNLHRQIIHSTRGIGMPKALSASETMKRLNPDVETRLHTVALDMENAPAIVEDYDIVVDCTDNMAARLVIDDVCHTLDRPYVFGAVRRWGGQIFTYVPGAPGYRDIFNPDPSVTAGELPCAIDGVMGSVVGVIGSLQATEVIKWIVSAGDLLTGRLLTFDAITMKFDEFKF